MRILSFDVGIKNLAYCLIDTTPTQQFNIIEWDVINLCGPELICKQTIVKKKLEMTCLKQAKYKKDKELFCRTCAKKSMYKLPSSDFDIIERKRTKFSDLHNLAESSGIDISLYKTKDDLVTALKIYKNTHCLETIKTQSASKLNLIDAGCAIQKYLDEKSFFCTADKIIIENQISPIANRMKTLQGMLVQYFITKNIKNIEFISASNKLKPFIGNTKTTYNERKKLSIEISICYLKKQNMMNALQCLVHHKKKDDLADSFLQGIVYLHNKNIISINYNHST